MKKRKARLQLLSIVLTVAVAISALYSSVAFAQVTPKNGVSLSWAADDYSIQAETADISQSTAYRTSDEETKSAAETENAAETQSTAETESAAETEAASEAESRNETESTGETEAAGETERIEETESIQQTEETEGTDASAVYENGTIKIYTLEQLMAVGTGQPLYSGDNEAVGSGEPVKIQEQEITYSLDGQYQLMNDIVLDSGNMWVLPKGFTGSFKGGSVSDTSTLYDRSTDTIYIYNNYQLMTIVSGDELKTVLSRDMIAEAFSMGQIVYQDEAQTVQLEYTTGHRYVLSKNFTSDMPELQAMAILNEEARNGRTYTGQVIYTDADGRQYILIGNEQQLRAIGTDIKVTEPVWKLTQTCISPGLDILGAEWGEDTYEVVYPGDADIDNGTQLYAVEHSGDLKDDNGNDYVILHKGAKRWFYYGSKLVTDDSGNITGYTYDTTKEKKHVNMESWPGASDAAYTSDGNYIIFRDIDLENKVWNPLMYSGHMEGRLNMETGKNPTISNIQIHQSGKLNISKQTGIGFFATISSNSSETDLGLSAGTVSVKNISLDRITVHNSSTELEDKTTVVGALGKLLGGLLSGVGGILDDLLGFLIPGLDGLNLEGLLGHLFDVRNDSLDNFATGAFAGRIIGDVEVSGCKVTNASVTNVKDMSGGFAGNIQGMTEYDGLSKALGASVEILTKVLNGIPGLGLGDLITILLDNNLLKAKDLIPTNYIQAKVENCSVSFAPESSRIGSLSTKYNGGFAGSQIGSRLSGCLVSGLSQVQASKYAGGFSGITRDAVIDGLLSALDVNIVPLKASSVTENCSVDGLNLQVISAGSYAGGFTGMAANSEIHGSAVRNLSAVTAENSYSGGFVGRATLGSGVILAGADEGDLKDNGLLGTVSGLLTGIAGGSVDEQLLNLVGVSPSVLKSNQISGAGDGITVTAKEGYAGGYFGQGDGLTVSGEQNQINNLKAVYAKHYVGGIGGCLLPANGAGVLDSTLGVANAMKFLVENVTVSGSSDGCSIAASEKYAGGALGLAVGGDIQNVILKNLSSVQADNDAGGFMGSGSPGSLVGGGGLNILGLIKVDKLLAVGDMAVVTVKDSKVEGKALEVVATGKKPGVSYFAGGFIGENMSADISDSSVEGLKRVSAASGNGAIGYAGGFAARSTVSGLAEVGDADTLDQVVQDGLINVDSLLGLVPYLMPVYTNCCVKFADNTGQPDAIQVEACRAGGFIGEMQGGSLDNTQSGDYAVYNIKSVHGSDYAGGFAGKILAGGLVDGGGLNIAGLSLANVGALLQVLAVYQPQIKGGGVCSDPTVDEAKASQTQGLRVRADAEDRRTDENAGSAGGFAGMISAARISESNVIGLATKKNISDSEPSASDWAVYAVYNAGGFAGKIDIGSTAAVGGGLSALGLLDLTNLLSAAAVTSAVIETSDVYGKAGGYNIGSETASAGGYAGVISGSKLNDSDAYDFEYITGVVSAGGYAGTMEPGNVASVVGEANIAEGAVSIGGDLLSLLETFITRVYNSETTAVPCGGYVKATGISDGSIQKGLAGGYVGYNYGSRIEGNAVTGDSNNDVLSGQKIASAARIRSVIGQEYAGGYTGLMQAANLADTGNLKLLFGAVQINNLLSAVQAVYATQTCTQVTGPLRGMALESWNGWSEAVGSKGAYGDAFAGQTFGSQEELDAWIQAYIYGYTVAALAENVNSTGIDAGGAAGGYVGRMEAGIIKDARAMDVMSVKAYRSVGGFAGEAITADVLNAGQISLGGLDVLDGLGGAVQTFVPVIWDSGVIGYKDGFIAEATAPNGNDNIGNAGGFVGTAYGLQVKHHEQSDFNQAESGGRSAFVKNLKSVKAHEYVGGFAGNMRAGTAAAVDGTSESGLINQILGQLIRQDTTSNLLTVLNATIPVVESALVEGCGGDGKRNFAVYGTEGDHARAAGGFAGRLTGAVIGTKGTQGSVVIDGISSVSADENAGGFFGTADVDGVASVSGDSHTSILDIVGLGGVDVLNAFRTYIYGAQVKGSVQYGLSVDALGTGGQKSGSETDAQYRLGSAGGFGGSLLDSTVENAVVTGLKKVNAANYAGGFIGLTGKSGVVDLSDTSVLQNLLKASAGVIDVFGSPIRNASVTGYSDGYTVKGSGGSETIAGGFVGFGDLTRIENCHASLLKQVYSDQTAGGFIGKTNFSYLAEINAGSPVLLKPVLQVVNELLKLLHVGDLENLGVISVQLPKPFDRLLSLSVLKDGDALSVTLLGLKISVHLVSEKEDGTAVVGVYIGDSYIELNAEKDADGHYQVKDENAVSIGLVKANRTRVANSDVKGIDVGYDIFGGGASNDGDGTAQVNGYAGGFVGYNNEGLLENNRMELADTIRGAAGLVGEFSGHTALATQYGELNNAETIEGNQNFYYVYRLKDEDNLTQLYKKDQSSRLDHNHEEVKAGDKIYHRYEIVHRGDQAKETNEHSLHQLLWENAYQSDGRAFFPANVYVSEAQADLMLGTPTQQNTDSGIKDEPGMQDPCDEQAALTIQKLWFDDNNSAGKRPASIQIQLLQDGKNMTGEDGKNVTITMDQKMEGSNKNIWSTTMKVPIWKEDGQGGYEKYVYEAVETPIAGYVTTYYVSEDGYTIYICNYLISDLMRGDTVVIDYGLPVEIDVLTNDKFSEYGSTDEGVNRSKLAGVGVYGETSQTLLEGTTDVMPEGYAKVADSSANGASVKGAYGTAMALTQGESDVMRQKAVVRYTPDTMQMDSFDRFIYAVQMDENTVKNEQNYVYGSVTIVPATKIYYEDNFGGAGGIEYTDGTVKEGAQAAGLWETVADENSAGAQVQDTDRPSRDQVIKDLDDWYGNDSHYRDDSAYSNGSIHVVTVSDANNPTKGGTLPTARFTFKGTGFDVVSLTSAASGTIKVQIYKQGENKAFKTMTVNTYYGYIYNAETGEWSVDPHATAENALYQVPIVKVEGLDYGTYKVVLTPMYKSVYDKQKKGSYQLYLDAIRIYNPVDTSKEDYKVIEDIYTEDGEANPQTVEFRDLLLNADEVSGIDANGVIFVDGNGSLSSMKDYESYGPKNEVYLNGNQAISFYLWAKDVPSHVRLSAKLAKGEQASLKISAAVKDPAGSDQTWKDYRITRENIATSYDLWYDFSHQCVWEKTQGGPKGYAYRTKYPVVIRNASENGGIISLTNLQWTGIEDEIITQAPSQDEKAVAAMVNEEVLLAAYSLMNPETAEIPESETESFMPEESETESFMPEESETESLVPEESETESFMPEESETESPAPEESQTAGSDENGSSQIPERESSTTGQPDVQRESQSSLETVNHGASGKAENKDTEETGSKLSESEREDERKDERKDEREDTRETEVIHLKIEDNVDAYQQPEEEMSWFMRIIKAVLGFFGL